MAAEYQVIERLPTLTEYKTVCCAVGWEPYINFDVAEGALQQSLFGVVVQYDEETVGMGRVVGDGHIFFYVQDIAVLPEHQGKGAGKQIMEAITAYLKLHAPEKSFIGLFSAAGKEAFYRQFGMDKHDGLTGMFGVIHENAIK